MLSSRKSNGNVFKDDVREIGHRLPTATLSYGGVENGEDAFGSRRAVSPRVEAGTQAAQGQVEFRRDDQKKKRLFKGNSSVKEAESNFDGDDGDADGRHQFQREGGEKGNAQDGQRAAPVTVADLCDDGNLRFGAVKELQRCQTL